MLFAVLPISGKKMSGIIWRRLNYSKSIGTPPWMSAIRRLYVSLLSCDTLTRSFCVITDGCTANVPLSECSHATWKEEDTLLVRTGPHWIASVLIRERWGYTYLGRWKRQRRERKRTRERWIEGGLQRCKIHLYFSICYVRCPRHNIDVESPPEYWCRMHLLHLLVTQIAFHSE